MNFGSVNNSVTEIGRLLCAATRLTASARNSVDGSVGTSVLVRNSVNGWEFGFGTEFGEQFSPVNFGSVNNSVRKSVDCSVRQID